MEESAGTGPVLHVLNVLALTVHVAAGSIGLVSGTIAAIARKGFGVHRKAGTLFVASMLVMAASAIYLGFAIPGQLLNVIIGIFAFYLVATGWVAATRQNGAIGNFERIALLVGAGLCAPFALLSLQLAMGLPVFLHSAMEFKGPIVIAVYVFTTVLAFAVIGDARVVLARRHRGTARIGRHLWRMCLGLSLAAGSGFTNGLARLLPGPYHVPPLFFVPTFIPLVLLAFWMIRVQASGKYGHRFDTVRLARGARAP